MNHMACKFGRQGYLLVHGSIEPRHAIERRGLLSQAMDAFEFRPGKRAEDVARSDRGGPEPHETLCAMPAP
jgi:hypothetical protein